VAEDGGEGEVVWGKEGDEGEDGVAEDVAKDVDVVIDLTEQLCQQDSLNVSHATSVLHVKKL